MPPSWWSPSTCSSTAGCSIEYGGQVESRFILHDTQAAEVPDFHTYYNSKVAGGTLVSSAYTLVNQIVQNGEPGPGLQHLHLPRNRRR